MPGEPAAQAHLDPARLEVDLVVHDCDRVERHLVEPRCGAERAPREVHVRLGLQQPEPKVIEPDLGELPRELRAERAVMTACELVDDHPAGVVAVAGVLAARVAQADDEEIERRGAFAPTEEAHRCDPLFLLSEPGSAASPSAGVSPSAVSPRRPRPRAARLPRPPRPPRARARPRRSGRRRSRSRSRAGSSRKTTPSSFGMSSRRRASPISIELTSASIDSGTSIGSASTLSVVEGCERTPPSLTPGASSPPCRWTCTVAWMTTSSRTSCRSTWRTCPRIGSRWYSFRIDGCISVCPSSTTSSTACRPDGPVRAERSSRSPTANACAVVLP